MAFPWIFEATFEAGTNGEWDSEQDTGTLLDFPHYSTLAKVPGLGMPFRGAYCMRVQPGDANDHTVTEDDIDIGDEATRYFRWYVWHNLTATADDIFNIFELQQADATVESCVSLQITASSGLVEIATADGTEASSGFTQLSPNVWHCIELTAKISTTSAGVLTLYVDGRQAQALTGLANAAAVGKGVLGTQGTLSTTTGTILFDQFVMDDARIGPIQDRFEPSVTLTKSGFVSLGPCAVDGAELQAGAGTDCVLELYDMDEIVQTSSTTVLGTHDRKLRLQNSVASDMAPPFEGKREFHRGCYAVLSGTNPMATVRLCRATGYGSEGAIRSWARHRPNVTIGA